MPSLRCIERGLPVAVWPPQARMCATAAAGTRVGSKPTSVTPGRKQQRPFARRRPRSWPRSRRARRWQCDFQPAPQDDICRSMRGSGSLRDHLRIEQAQRSAGSQLTSCHMPLFAVADAGNPVPAFGGDERRAVDGQVAAILTRARRPPIARAGYPDAAAGICAPPARCAHRCASLPSRRSSANERPADGAKAQRR